MSTDDYRRLRFLRRGARLSTNTLSVTVGVDALIAIGSAARSQPYYLDDTHRDANKGDVVVRLSDARDPGEQIATPAEGALMTSDGITQNPPLEPLHSIGLKS